MQRKPRESAKPLKERVVESSKAIFIDVKFIHTLVVWICLQHWMGANYCAREGTKKYSLVPTPKS